MSEPVVPAGTPGETRLPASAPGTAPAVPPAAAPAVEHPITNPTPPAVLVSWGIATGVFVLYAIGWLIAVLRGDGAAPSAAVDSNTLEQAMLAVGHGVVVAAGPLWLAGAYLLTRGRSRISQASWLVAGVVLLVPWPFIVGM